MADEGHKPTSGMKSAAKRALAWHKEGKRGGTSVGYARANQIVNGESLSDDTVKRMYSFFSRHEVDKKATGFNSGEEGYPSPGRVAWDLWGGDAGYAFARSKVKHTIKKMITDEITKVIGGSSSQHQHEDEAGTPESYVRKEDGGENNMSQEIEKTTEPDPEGDIAVLKSVDSDLARRKINKAIKSLQKALNNLPDVARADSVTVSQEAAPVNKADGLPNVSRADSVTVSQETAPVNKDVGKESDTVGVGENSQVANTTVDREAGVVTKACDCGDCAECKEKLSKAACCKAAGPECTGDCCEKCACMGKDITSAEVVNVEKAVDTDDDADKEPDEDEDDKVYKSAQDLINDAKISKSVWGGAFGAPNIPRIK